MFHKVSGIEEKSWIRGGSWSVTIFRQKILVHTVEIVRREILECFIKFRNRKTSCMRGVHQDFCRFFLWRTSKKLRRGILLCFRNILIWKNFLDKRVGRGWSIICLREKFLSHSGEKVRRKILQCFIHFGYRNTL